MTWTGWDTLRNKANENGIIYKRGDSNINPYIQAIDDLLMLKNATDVALIFEDERGSEFFKFFFPKFSLKIDIASFNRVESESLLFDRKLDPEIDRDRRIHRENGVEDQEYEAIAVLLRYLCQYSQDGGLLQNCRENFKRLFLVKKSNMLYKNYFFNIKIV